MVATDESRPAGRRAVGDEARLAAWMERAGVEADHLLLDAPCHSVAAAAAAAGAPEAAFVKSLCLAVRDLDGLVVAVVPGTARADLDRVAQAVGAPAGAARMATPDEVRAGSGYPVGGVPPFGFDATWLMDPQVLEMERLYAGGGSDRALVRTTPAAVREAAGARVVPLVRKV